MSEIQGRQYIGGARSALGQAVLESHAALDGAPYPVKFFEATHAEVQAAAASAARAYPAYRHLSAAARADFLDAIADEIDALGDDFIAEVQRETALPAARLAGERGRTSGQMRLFAKMLRRGDWYGARIDRALPDRQPLPRPDLRQYQIGLGPVAVFGASNFPLAFSVAGGDTAAALAAGCPVVVKAHPGHLVTSEGVADAIGRAAARCDMPAGVFNLVYGGNAVSAWLVQAAPIRAVGFTGSLQGGRALFDLAAARPDPIPVFAEMSSINPVIVLPQAQQARAADIARDLAASVALGCGQFCTNPGLVLLLRTPHSGAFIEALRTALQSQAPQPMLHGGILANYRSGTQRLRQTAGIATLVSGHDEQRAAPHLFVADKALLLSGAATLQEEVFGPSTVVVELDGEAELLAAIAHLHGQLTATLIGESAELPHYRAVLAALEEKVGRVLFNGFPTGVEVCDAMVHGGPYPATTDARGTSVGTLAIARFLRPVCYQNTPDALLPPALQDANPLGLLRLVDGAPTREPITPAR
ncbi:MAG: aldehyde dehydrogenase (NADP(+)) [Burkholderiales bacterium]|nr:aldehyde dehydrogenase (NADP(+)) [Burkholderiales bacterium]